MHTQSISVEGDFFIATAEPFELGIPIELEIDVPGIGTTSVKGEISWIKETNDQFGPKGVGIKFSYIDDKLSSFIDHLVSNFLNIEFLVFSAHLSDAENIVRTLRSIIGTAEIRITSNLKKLKTVALDPLDLIVVDVDEDEKEAQFAIEWLKTHPSNVPVIALASTDELKMKSIEWGAFETAHNPPQFNELRMAVVKTISEPFAISSTT